MFARYFGSLVAMSTFAHAHSFDRCVRFRFVPSWGKPQHFLSAHWAKLALYKWCKLSWSIFASFLLVGMSQEWGPLIQVQKSSDFLVPKRCLQKKDKNLICFKTCLVKGHEKPSLVHSAVSEKVQFNFILGVKDEGKVIRKNEILHYRFLFNKCFHQSWFILCAFLQRQIPWPVYHIFCHHQQNALKEKNLIKYRAKKVTMLLIYRI